MLKKIALATAALSLTAAPIAAQQAQQSAQPASEESDLGAFSGPNLFFYLGIAIVAVSILLLSENDDPVSA